MNDRISPNDLHDPLSCALISAGLSALTVVVWLSGSVVGNVAAFHLFPCALGMFFRSLGASVERRQTSPKSAPCGEME